MKTYLTEYDEVMPNVFIEGAEWLSVPYDAMEKFLNYGKKTGPRIEANRWEEAEKKLRVLIEFGMAHPETEVIGELMEEHDA